jgi:addiction module HigA family antidote
MTEYRAKRSPGFEPPHPGALLRDEALPFLGLTVTNAAAMLRVSRQTLHAILSGKAAITPGMALRIGKLCGNGPDLWLGMQQAYDLWHARRELAEIVEAIPTLRAA